MKKLLSFIAIVTLHSQTATTEPLSIQDYNAKIHTDINTLDKLAAIYPKTVKEIEQWTNAAIESAKQELDQIVTTSDYTFAHTMQILDTTSEKVKTLGAIIATIAYVHPNKEMREAAFAAEQQLQEFGIDAGMNPKLYQIIQQYRDTYSNTEDLSSEDILLLTDYLESCKLIGLHLPEETLEKVKQIKKEIASLEQEFMVNYNNDDSTITATIDELDGINEDFIKQLDKQDDLYIISCKPATATPVMTECKVEETRKKMFFTRNNGAYPQNNTVLVNLLHKRHQLAKLLGHDSYASLDLSTTSAQDITKVEEFLLPLAQQCHTKQIQEFAQLKQSLPADITLHKDGSFNPWDYGYVYNEFIKKEFDIDEAKLAEYFPVQKVIDGIFTIYQNFLGLTFKQVKPTWSWHEDVMLLEIYRTSSQELLGYLFLDLYPRPNKYSHACVMPTIGSHKLSDKNNTSLATLIMSVNKPTSETPSLLKFNDVITFFHEFGHAMHNVLSRTKHAGHAGINVADDFAEVPSQMFEQWMFEPDMLDLVSGHYKTGEKLPKDLIEKRVNLRKNNSGAVILRQCMYSLFALRLMTNNDLSYNPHALWKSLHDQYLTGLISYEDNNHHYALFGHLAHSGYAAKYYSYLWTEVFAIDLFAQIKAHNFNTEFSQKVIDLLSAGGSVNPDTLLENFLGRKPNQEAFLKALNLQ